MKILSRILLSAILIGLFFAVSSVALAEQNPDPHITSLEPSSGPVGTQVTITGTGFLSGQIHQIFFQRSNLKYYVTEARASDTHHLQFTVPSSLNHSGGTNSNVSPGQYKVKVYYYQWGSNEVSFTVTDSNTPPPPPPSGSPTATLTVNGQLSGSVAVGSSPHYEWHSTNASAANGDKFQTTYTVPDPQNCTSHPSAGIHFWAYGNTANGEVTGSPRAEDAGCTFVFTYTVTKSNGQSVSATMTVVHSSVGTPPPPSGSPHIDSIDPNSGFDISHIHSFTIFGSGFTPTGNNVTICTNVGVNNSLSNLRSSNGTSIAVPDSDHGGFRQSCFTSHQYPVVVQNANGTSNAVNITITSGGGHRASVDTNSQLATVFSAIDEILAQKNTYGLTADTSKVLDWLWGNVSEIVTGER